MSTAIAESPMRSKIKERRRIADVVSDLLASSRQVPTPAGLITLVDTRFLRELVDVQVVTGELLLAVVDAEHLERTVHVTGATPPSSAPSRTGRGKPTVTQIRDLKHHYGWTNREMAIEFGVSDASIYLWTSGGGSMTGDRLRRFWELADAMEADKARESGVPE